MADSGDCGSVSLGREYGNHDRLADQFRLGHCFAVFSIIVPLFVQFEDICYVSRHMDAFTICL